MSRRWHLPCMDEKSNNFRPVLILGAGINGCALARELLLNNVPVCLVDQRDIASGATAYSSRLIHGGLRYLEYGEFDLVRESLAERTRLLRLAPHLVKPLRLSIPTTNRFGGFVTSALRFIGWRWWPAGLPGQQRGLAMVRLGLNLYDAYARDPLLPRHSVARVTESPLPVDRSKYRWLCTYYDAQVPYPERLTLAMLRDAQELSKSSGVPLCVLTYHEAHLDGDLVRVTSRGDASVSEQFKPIAVVNATGAWVDRSLQRLEVPSELLIGGTKGSHLVTFHAGLRAALGDQGIYAEAGDGRPVFIMPLGDACLIGTTDIPWQQCPDEARATADEVEYLLDAVRTVLPDLRLSKTDVDFHYSGVRPLPYADQERPAGITRRHFLVRHEHAPLPVYSIVGGKLTTCRSLAQTAAAQILSDLGHETPATSEARVFPGGEDYPQDEQALTQVLQRLAQESRWSLESVKAIWQLHGSSTFEIVRKLSSELQGMIPDTVFPVSFVRWTIQNEWVRTLDDLVERRLMLLYHQRLTRACLAALAELLVREQHRAASEIAPMVASTAGRLSERYGKQVVD